MPIIGLKLYKNKYSHFKTEKNVWSKQLARTFKTIKDEKKETRTPIKESYQ